MTANAPPRYVLPHRELDVPSLASAVSAVHAAISRHGGEGMAMGPGGASLGAAVRRVAPRIERAVAEATQPHVSPPRSLRPNPARLLAARAATATLNGMSAGIAAARGRAAAAMRPGAADARPAGPSGTPSNPTRRRPRASSPSRPSAPRCGPSWRARPPGATVRARPRPMPPTSWATPNSGATW